MKPSGAILISLILGLAVILSLIINTEESNLIGFCIFIILAIYTVGIALKGVYADAKKYMKSKKDDKKDRRETE